MMKKIGRLFVCPLAVALALVGAGGRLSFCLVLRLSAAVLGGLFVFFLTLIRII